MATTIFHLPNFKPTKHLKKLFCKLLTKETGKRWSSKYFLTTPIFYVNAEPHIGHLYTAVIGDAANRFQKLKNPSLKTKFMVGTDEHGLKVTQAADKEDVNVKVFCDQVSEKYRDLFKLCSIDHDDFVRTTEERHVRAATALWNKILSKELIYRDNYAGWYCVADETFVAEQYLDPKTKNSDVRVTLDGKKPVQYMEEENYKFKLSSFQNDLLHWLKDDVIKPRIFQLQLMKWIEEGKILQDISVSRPSDRVPWGIPVPGDPSQTIYVWMDALSSYLCTNGYPESSFKWPPDVQVIGKDILRFHGVFWPAFLIAADLEPPKCLRVHSHWLKDDRKMSKSYGNVIDPFDRCNKYTSDGLRYFLLRGGVPHSDGNFSDHKVRVYLNSEIADSLGNLLGRCTSKSINPGQIFPALFEDYKKYFDKHCENLVQAVEQLPGEGLALISLYCHIAVYPYLKGPLTFRGFICALEKVITHYDDFDFYKGISAVMEVLHSTNRFFQIRQPWIMDKEPNHVTVTLHLTFEALRVCGILLQPIIPNVSSKLLDKLSIPVGKRNMGYIRPYSWSNIEVESTNLTSASFKLFRRI